MGVPFCGQSSHLWHASAAQLPSKERDLKDLKLLILTHSCFVLLCKPGICVHARRAVWTLHKVSQGLIAYIYVTSQSDHLSSPESTELQQAGHKRTCGLGLHKQAASTLCLEQCKPRRHQKPQLWCRA